LRNRRAKPCGTWHLDEVYLKIAGRMVYLWRAVDAEGEVLDVLVQSKRNKTAALKLMRKLLRKCGFAPDRMVTDRATLGSRSVMSAVNGGTTASRIRISRPDAGSVRCNFSRARAQPRSFSLHTRPSTTISTPNAILSPPGPIEALALRL
jgi:transposase-like protein